MNEVTYEIGISLPLAKMIAPIQELEESIASNLAKFGCEGVRPQITYVQPMTLKVNRQFTETEMEQMKTILTDQAKRSFGFAKIEYVRRQSGNVQQSAS